MGNYDHPVSESVRSIFKETQNSTESEPKMRVMVEIREDEKIILTLDLDCLKSDLQTIAQIVLGKFK